MAVAPKNIFEIKKKYIGAQDALNYSLYVPEKTGLNVEKDKWSLVTQIGDIVLKGEKIYDPSSYMVSYKIHPCSFISESWSFFVIKSISLPEGYNVSDYSYDIMIDGQRIDKIHGFMTEILQDYVFDMDRQEIPFGILASVNGVPWFSRHYVQLEVYGDKPKPKFLYFNTYKLKYPKEQIEYPIFQTQYTGQEKLEHCEKSNSYVTRLNFNHITYYLFAKMDASFLSSLSRVELHVWPAECKRDETNPDILELSIIYLENNTILLPLTPNIRNDSLDKYGLNLSRCYYQELHFFFLESEERKKSDCVVDVYAVSIQLARAMSGIFGLAFSK